MLFSILIIMLEEDYEFARNIAIIKEIIDKL